MHGESEILFSYDVNNNDYKDQANDTGDEIIHGNHNDNEKNTIMVITKILLIETIQLKGYLYSN